MNNARGDMGASKPPPLSQIHHSKINQRQDSNISSDSMMSSPGFNTKTMDAPLLQNASRMNKSKNIHHQNSTDSFIMSNMNRSAQRGAHTSKREESSISNDSLSQTSSPGCNPNMLDAPLMARAVKLNSCKYKHVLESSFNFSSRKNQFYSHLHRYRQAATIHGSARRNRERTQHGKQQQCIGNY